MKIVPRGKGYQVSFSFEGDRKRKTLPTYEEAELWGIEERQRLRKAREEGVKEGVKEGKKEPKGMTLEKLRSEVIRYHWSHTKSAKTAELNSATVCKTLGGHRVVGTITMGDIEEAISEWKDDGKADGTINRLLSALSKMLNYAVDKDYIVKAPKIPRLKEVNGRIRYLTMKEEKELLAYFTYIGADQMHDLCIVAMDTGMRQGELLNLQVRDVTLTKQSQTISVWDNKADHPRTIPLTQRTTKVLKALTHDSKQTDKVFGMTRDSVRHYWDRARNHLGYVDDKQYVFHMLRHTFCSRLAQKNVSIGAIQALAGHKTITMTQRYAHLNTASLTSAIGVLNQ